MKRLKRNTVVTSMEKTAEEILKNHIQGDEEKGMPAYMASMREFAAQEVEAYKIRLKAEVETLRTMTADPVFLAPLSIFKDLIDAVKWQKPNLYRPNNPDMFEEKKQEYRIEKIVASVRIGLAGCVQKATLEVEIPIDARPGEIEILKEQAAQEWANNFIEVSYTDV